MRHNKARELLVQGYEATHDVKGIVYEHIWKEDPVDCDHIIRNTICQLCRKLERPELIQTVMGYGYKFVVESEADQCHQQ